MVVSRHIFKGNGYILREITRKCIFFTSYQKNGCISLGKECILSSRVDFFSFKCMVNRQENKPIKF